MDQHELKIPWSRPDIGNEEAKMIQKVLDSGWISMGPMVKEFETKFAGYIKSKYAIMMNNGTSALLATYLAIGIKPKDRVLVPSYTFIATVNALIVLGAIPILMDADRDTFNVTPEIVEDSIKRNAGVKYVVIVDVAGMPCDLDGIAEVCRRYDATLIEDAAEAIGGEYKGRKVGTGSHPVVFSFHAAKLLTAIEGGAITTGDSNLAEKLGLIRSHGEDPKNKYWHISVGLNLRPLEFQAALALAQLPKVNQYIRNRNKIARAYIESMVDVLKAQKVPDYVTCHPYMLFLGLAKNRQSRDGLIKRLATNGIDYRIPWPPANIQKIGYSLKFHGREAENLFDRVLSLPLFNNMTKREAEYVISSVVSN